jgi:hypothetical protein
MRLLVLAVFLSMLQFHSAASADNDVIREAGNNETPVSRDLIVNLAGILPEDDNRLFSISHLAPAADIAITHIDTWDIFARNQTGRSVRLSMSYKDSRCSDSVAMNEAINYYIKGDTAAFFGPVCDFAVAPVARQVVFWDTPLVSVGAVARDFRLRRKTVYPLLTRAGPANLHDLVSLFLRLLTTYHWRRYKILYERNGHDDVVTQLCHLVTETIVFDTEALPKEHTIRGTVTSLKPELRYYRFTEDDSFDDVMVEEIGRENFSGECLTGAFDRTHL